MSVSRHRSESTAALSAPIETSFKQTANLLGGRQALKKVIASKLDVHEVIVKGIPGVSLKHMVDNVKTIDTADVLRAVGISVRTIQRRMESPQKPLSQEQSGRAWKFAEVLVKATEVFGSQAEAEKWLVSPAMALDQRRPIDLLSSPTGVEMVEQLLGRIEYGVYT
ncbi:MAG: type II RES/Xre toxin-antitoxin system antitoxin [Pyrinomonadaceae bacterium]